MERDQSLRIRVNKALGRAVLPLSCQLSFSHRNTVHGRIPPEPLILLQNYRYIAKRGWVFLIGGFFTAPFSYSLHKTVSVVKAVIDTVHDRKANLLQQFIGKPFIILPASQLLRISCRCVIPRSHSAKHIRF